MLQYSKMTDLYFFFPVYTDRSKDSGLYEDRRIGKKKRHIKILHIWHSDLSLEPSNTEREIYYLHFIDE